MICERLARHLHTAQLFRLNWWQRVSASMPAKLRPYTLDVNDIFEIPNPSILHSYQVIVCNCGTAGVLKTLNTPQPLTFDLVIVDEASQAIESEVRAEFIAFLAQLLFKTAPFTRLTSLLDFGAVGAVQAKWPDGALWRHQPTRPQHALSLVPVS